MKLSLATILLLVPYEAQGFARTLSTHSQTRKRPSSGTITSSNRALDTINLPLFGNSLNHNDIDSSMVNNRHSASDWLYNVRSIPQSKVLREVRNPVLAVAGWALVVSSAQRLFSHSKQSILQTFASKMCIPGTAHGFLVSALALLLVFRTNSSYQRFYEGRKIWENILNHSRNLSRMIQLYSKEVGKERKQLLLNLLAAYPYLLRHHIRPGCLCESPDGISPANRLLMQEPKSCPVDTRFEGDKDLSKRQQRGSKSSLTSPKDCWVDKEKLPWSLFQNKSLEKLSRAKNRPLWVCDRLGKEMMRIKYGPNFTSRERLTMLGLLSKLTDSLGQCERIHQTAVPLNYARHSLRSLTLWLFTLPFALVKDMGLLTVPVVASVAWLLYGIYQIGYSIEDPFQGSLRLSILCDAIRSDVLGDNEEDRFSAYSADEESWEDNEESEVYGKGLSHKNLIPPVSNSSVEAFLRDTVLVDKNHSWVTDQVSENILVEQ